MNFLTVNRQNQNPANYTRLLISATELNMPVHIISILAMLVLQYLNIRQFICTHTLTLSMDTV